MGQEQQRTKQAESLALIKYVNKNLHSRGDQLVFNVKDSHSPSSYYKPFRSYSCYPTDVRNGLLSLKFVTFYILELPKYFRAIPLP